MARAAGLGVPQDPQDLIEGGAFPRVLVQEPRRPSFGGVSLLMEMTLLTSQPVSRAFCFENTVSTNLV